MDDPKKRKPTKEELRKKLEEAAKAAEVESLKEEVKKALEEAKSEAEDLSRFITGLRVYATKVGKKGAKTVAEKYKEEITKKIERLKALRERLPRGWTEEREKLRKMTENLEDRLKRLEVVLREALELPIPEEVKPPEEKPPAPVTAPAVAPLPVEELKKLIKETVSEVVEEKLKPLRRLEVIAMEAEFPLTRCLCYECGKRPAVKFLGNKGYCSICAEELERKYARQGLTVDWNPPGVCVCTLCGKPTKRFVCSAGFCYCLKCAEKMRNRLMFDVEAAPLHLKIRDAIRESLRDLLLY